MGKIKVTPCPIEGLYVIEPTVFKDERGYFMETYWIWYYYPSLPPYFAHNLPKLFWSSNFSAKRRRTL